MLLGFGVLVSGPQRAAWFLHLGNLTRRPGAAEESYSAHRLLCKKKRPVPKLTTRFLSQQSVFTNKMKEDWSLEQGTRCLMRRIFVVSQ